MIIKKLQLFFIPLSCLFFCNGSFAGINEINDLDRDYINNGEELGKGDRKKVKLKNLKPLKFKKNAKRIGIQSKPGMVYSSVNKLIFPNAKNKFIGGFGRVALVGKSKKGNCEADLFFNKHSSTLFAAIYFDNQRSTREFYLDHPFLIYSDVLSQYMLSETNKAGKISKVAIVVEGDKSGFKIIRDLKQMDFVFSNQEKVVEHCIFDLSLIQYFDGEQE